MLKFFLFLVYYICFQVHATEFSAGIRESFVTRFDYPFGSDSSARVRKKLKGAGFNRFTLNTRLSLIDGQFIRHPLSSSKNSDLKTMISLIRFGGGKVSIKPQLMVGDLDKSQLAHIGLINTRLSLSFYKKELNRYLSLSRSEQFDELIIGAGLSELYLKSSPELFTIHQYVKKFKSDNTKLSLYIKDFNHLPLMSEQLIANIKQNFDSLCYFYDNDINDKEYLNKLLDYHQRFFPLQDASLCDVMIREPDDKKALQRFNALNNIFVSKDLKYVDYLMATTDYEPSDVNPIYLYYRSLHLRVPTVTKTLEKLPPLKYPRNKGHKACIFFDKFDSDDQIGEIHSTMLESLMGAFPDFYVRKYRVQAYTTELKTCKVAFYLGTHFDADLPKEFIKDVSEFINKYQFVWLNYKVDQLGDNRLGFKSSSILQADTLPTRNNYSVGFYQYFDYKGETFFKNSGWSLTTDNFLSSAEINLIELLSDDVKVYAWARHNKSNQKIPYIVSQKMNKGKIWYIADSPFSYVHYEDRYLIFTDILWDVLDVKPPKGQPKALLRIEDVNPSLNLSDLRWAMEYLYREKVPFSMATIPYFVDLIGSTALNNFRPLYTRASFYPDFSSLIKQASSFGGSIVFHGVAHQVDDFISGYLGQSGADYEFWLYPENTPIPYDSVDWVMDRLEMGEKIFQEWGIRPVAWELPHYAASVLDYKIFSKVFEWNYHRSVIFPFKVISDSALKKEHLMFDCLNEKCRQERRMLLRNIEVDANYQSFGATLYPYPVYADAYGQKVIPETLGMIDFAMYDPNTWRPVNQPKDIIRRAKKLKVIRGAYASFFWHSALLNKRARYYDEVPGSYENIGGRNSLIKTVEGIKELGYEFISIGDCRYFTQKGCH